MKSTLFMLDDDKSNEFQLAIKNRLPQRDCKITIYPFSDFKKDLIILEEFDFSKTLKEINYVIKILKPVSLMEIKKYCEDIAGKGVFTEDSYLNYLIETQSISIIVNPIHFWSLLTDEFASPRFEMNFRLTNDQRLVTLFLISNDFPGIIDIIVQKLKEIAEEIDNKFVKNAQSKDVPQDQEKLELINGFLYSYHPPQIFLKFHLNLNIYFRFLWRESNNEILFEKNSSDYGSFILWRVNNIFISKGKLVKTPLEFVNLFCFYIFLYNKDIESLSLIHI